jgi:hypothetical protein
MYDTDRHEREYDGSSKTLDSLSKHVLGEVSEQLTNEHITLWKFQSIVYTFQRQAVE